jgi:hypothetical protein
MHACPLPVEADMRGSEANLVMTLAVLKTSCGINTPIILRSVVTRSASKCSPVLGTTTKSDFVLTRPRPSADLACAVQPVTQSHDCRLTDVREIGILHATSRFCGESHAV